MAIYHFALKHISRSQGHSSTAAAAYRAAAKVYDERTGRTFDFRRKEGVISHEILTPSRAPQWAREINSLWNKCEESESRNDARVAREIVIALPYELKLSENKEWLRSYVKEAFVKRGMVAQINIHSDGHWSGDKRNIHAHILLSVRPCTRSGFGKQKPRIWNDKSTLRQWREQACNHMNNALEKAGLEERVDHRSFVDQGKERFPTKHMGSYCSNLERVGVATRPGDQNRQARENNALLEQIDARLEQISQTVKQAQEITVSRGGSSEKKEEKSGRFKVDGNERESVLPEELRQQIIEDQSEKLRLCLRFNSGCEMKERTLVQKQEEIDKAGFWEKLCGKTKNCQKEVALLQDQLRHDREQEKKELEYFKESFSAGDLLNILEKYSEDYGVDETQLQMFKASQNQLARRLRHEAEDREKLRKREKQLQEEYETERLKNELLAVDRALEKSGMIERFSGRRKKLEKQKGSLQKNIGAVEEKMAVELSSYAASLEKERQQKRLKEEKEQARKAREQLEKGLQDQQQSYCSAKERFPEKDHGNDFGMGL